MSRETRFKTVNNEPSRTKQSFAEECDVNSIVKRHDARALVQSLSLAERTYADVTTFQDFHQVMNTLVQAEQDFQQLPSEARAIFDNDVANWLDTAHDADKRNALVDLGLLPETERVTLPAAASAAAAPPAAQPPAEPAGGAPAPPAAT